MDHRDIPGRDILSRAASLRIMRFVRRGGSSSPSCAPALSLSLSDEARVPDINPSGRSYASRRRDQVGAADSRFAAASARWRRSTAA